MPKTTSFRHMKLHVKSQIVMYVNSRPSTHIHLRNLFISLHNLIITYIPFIAMYKLLNLPPILYLCLVLMGLRGGCGVEAAGCLWIGSCSAVCGVWSVSHPGSDFYQSKSRSRGPARAHARALRAHERRALAVTASLSLVTCADIIT